MIKSEEEEENLRLKAEEEHHSWLKAEVREIIVVEARLISEEEVLRL